MDPIKNPYTPGAGTRPRAMAGREEELKAARQLLDRIAAGQVEQSMLIIGLRGVGKTVLLNTIADFAEQRGFQSAQIEIMKRSDFRASMARAARRILLGISPIDKAKDRLKRAMGVLQAFSLTLPDGPEVGLRVEPLSGSADSGDLSEDLSELLVEVGRAAKAHNKAVALFFDELQDLDQESLSSLIVSMHRIAILNLPVTLVGAGLPQLPSLTRKAKSYAERLFVFPEIDSLNSRDARIALVDPASELGVSFTGEAIDLLYELTGGYPYFIQEYGKHIWNHSTETEITPREVDVVKPIVIQHLDSNFFRARIDESTTGELRYMRAMAGLGKGPYKSTEIAGALEADLSSVSSMRARLIKKGFIFSTKRGECSFSVPQFDEFLTRTYPRLN